MPIQVKNLLKIRPLTMTAMVVLAVSLAYVAGVPFLDLMEYRTMDLRFRFRGPVPPGPEVVLAVIDEKSIAEEGKWIWPRVKIAELVRALSDAGAAVVGMDIGFLEEDINSTGKTVGKIRTILEQKGLADEQIESELLRLEKEGDNDLLLAQAIRDSKTPVVLGFFFQMSDEGLGKVGDKDKELFLDNSRGALFNVTTRAPGEYPLTILDAFMPEANITVLSEATEWSGYFNMVPDEDGTVRRLPMAIACGGSVYAPLSLKTLQAYLRHRNPGEKANLDLKISRFGVSGLSVGKIRVPADERGRLLINYRGGTKSFPHVSVTDILAGGGEDGKFPATRNGSVERISLKDKIILVGATAIGIFDLRVTPFSAEDYPGLEIHANVVDNILHGNFLVQPNWVKLVDLAAILVLAAVLGVFLPGMKVSTGAGLTFSLFAGYLTVSQVLFTRQGSVLNLVYPVLALILMYVSTTVYKYVTEERQKRFLRSAFSTYLAPSVVEQIIRNPEKLALGGEKRVITAFFSDVQGFTSISQKLDAPELVELLNEFLTEMTDIILEHEGTVDKFEGDAIIAFFGAPNDVPDHAARACVACVEMQKKLVDLRAKWAAEGRPQLRMRIGMDTGYAVVGNMGSRSRMDYTMMGDMVNTAARLEGVNKVYGTYTMVSNSTFEQAGGLVFGRELDAVNVVGRSKPVGIFEIIGLKDEVPEPKRRLVEHYARGLADYRGRRFKEAYGHFKNALALDPDDGPSKTMIERCREYHKTPPPPEWNGSYTMTSK